MTTTAKYLIQRAMGARTANDPDDLATPQELIEVLSDNLLELYGKANAINGWFFSQAHTVTGTGASWARPTGSNRVLYIHGGGNAGTGADAVLSGNADPVADRVSLVPLHDFDADFAPRIYRLGPAYYPGPDAAEDPSPSINGDRITFISTDVHPALDPSEDWDHANNTLDGYWPEEFNTLLIAGLRQYLADKDGREGEAARLEKKVAELTVAFLARVSLADAYEIDRRSQ